MRILFLTLSFLISCIFSNAQDITFTYQSGLTSPIHRIIPIPGSNTYIIAERNGGILAWDIVSNKILHKITTANTEIADVTYSANDKKIFVAGETGIEILDASKLLTDHIIQPYHTYDKERITALYWNESKNLLRAATEKGELLNFSGIKALKSNKPTTIISTGIQSIFSIRDIDNRICVLGRQKQAFISNNGKLLFSSANNTTGLFGHAFHDMDSSIYIAHEANIVKLTYRRNRFTVSRYDSGIEDYGALVQGIAVNQQTNEVFAGTNRNTILELSKAGTREVFNSPDGSFTGLLIHEGKMLAGDFFGNVLVIDTATWKKQFQLNEDATPSLNGVFLDRNRMVSTHFGLRGFAVKIWDLPTASLAKSFNVKGDIAYEAGFSQDGDTIFSAHTDDAIYQYYGDGGSFRMDTLLSPSRSFMYGSIFFNVELDKKSRREKNIKTFTTMLEEPGIHAFPADTAYSTEIVFVNSLKVPDECVQGKLPSNYRVSEAYLAALDLVNESSEWDMLDKDLFYMRACSSPTLPMFLERVAEKRLDTAKAARFYRAIKGQEEIAPFFYIKSVTEEKTLLAFNRKQKLLYADISRMPEMALIFYADSLLVWNGKTRQTTSLNTGFSDMDYYYDFTERYVALADSRSGSIALFSLTPKQKSTATKWFSFGEEDYLVHNKKGYYKIRGRSNRINFSIDKKPLSFQSFDLKYNRPDLLMEDIGASDSTLIVAYRAAALKRIRRSGMNTSQPGTDLPVLDFANRDSISYQQQSEKLQLHISGGDNKSTIDRFNIWVNEVPLFGANGHNIRSQKSKAIDTTIEILLSPGENRIETSLTTTSGVESYRRPLRVNYKSNSTSSEMLYFIGIGIDHFKDSKYNLQYSVEDIRDLCLRLKAKYGNNILIDTLFNEEVTVENVRALKKKLSTTGINDKVIISYSGHGLLNKDFDYFLSTYKVSFVNPEDYGLPYSDLENLVDSIPARRKLILIDACHSGEVDKEDLVTLNEITDPQVKGLKPVQHKQPQVGLKNSFELMQDLFLNVGKSTGATVISAAAGTQFALERIDLQNGVFTYAILEAMEKYPTLKVSELRRIVGERVVQLTNGRQVPTTRTETLSVDWNVW